MAAKPPSRAAIRVGYVLSLRNGIHSFIYRELEELERRGVFVTIFAISMGPGPYPPKPQWKVVPASLSDSVRGSLAALANRPFHTLTLALHSVLTRSVVDFGIALGFFSRFVSSDLRFVHSHFGDHKLFVAYYLHRLLDIPLTVTIHAYELYENPNSLMFREALKNCARIVTISEYNKQLLRERYGVEESRVQVVRLFSWPVEEVPEVARSGSFTILCVGRFAPKKGHEVLLRAVRRLVDLGHSDVRVVLVTNDSVRLTELVRGFGLVSHAHVLSNLPEPELRLIYANSDVFCLPSLRSDQGDQEGIPVSLMEAMAYGKPVVTTSHAGIPELVRENLVPERDSDAVVEALLRLKTDPNRAAEQGRVNRKIVKERYSARNVDDLINVWREVQDGTP